MASCPHIAKCPIFQQGVFVHEGSAETYKTVYCLRTEKFPTCKRFILMKELGKELPATIMPNSLFSIEELKKMIS